MRLIHNNVRVTPTKPRYSQGQLVLITEIAEDNTHKIRLKMFPTAVRDVQDFAHWNTPEFTLTQQRSPMVMLKGHQKAWRYQFPIVHNCTTTAHKCIDETYDSPATDQSCRQSVHFVGETRVADHFQSGSEP